MLIGPRLQAAGINFVDCQARHGKGGSRIDSIILSTDEDLLKFAKWAGENDINFDSARVATQAELDEQKKWEDML